MNIEYENKYGFHSKEYGLLAKYMSVGAYEYIVTHNKSLENMLDFETTTGKQYGSQPNTKLLVRYVETQKGDVGLIEKYLNEFIILVKKHEKKLITQFTDIEESSELYPYLKKLIEKDNKKNFKRL